MITLTKKANGRYYLGMEKEDLKLLRIALNLVEDLPRDLNPQLNGNMLVFGSSIAKISAQLNKPARGETESVRAFASFAPSRDTVN